MDVQLYGAGPNSNIELQVDPTFQAGRISIRPTDYTTLGGVNGGHYSVAAMTGAMAAGIVSGSEVFHVRWADPSKLFILKRLMVQCCTGTGFAATSQGQPLDLILGHGSTANGSGGTAIQPNSISQKMRAIMAATAFATSGRIGISSTGALTAPSGQTLEPAPIGICLGAPNATLQASGQMVLWETQDMGDHPVVLNSGDTLAVRAVNGSGTGTWYMSVNMEWIESVNY